MNATIILDECNYNKKILDHLECGSYRMIDNNPREKVMRDISRIMKNPSLDDSTKKNLIPSNAILPRIYGLPKIHKDRVPLRPIVNTIGSPTYLLSKFLAKKLLPMAGNTSSFIKNSTSFVDWVKNIEVNKEDILVSFDIVSLYTMIPIEEAIDGINYMTDGDIANLVRTCLKSTYFSYQGNIYEHIHGIAMGYPLSPIIANIYMEHFKMKAINSFPFTADEWKRYVDDIFAKWRHRIDNLDDFLARLNSLSKHIKLTIDMEKDGKIPFLDVLLTKKEYGGLGIPGVQKGHPYKQICSCKFSPSASPNGWRH